MEEIISTLQPILDDRLGVFGIREVSRIVGVNHTTIRHRLLRYEQQGYIVKKVNKNFTGFTASRSHTFQLLKKYYNVKKLYDSELLEYINKLFDYPTIVLFGSYAHAEDIPSSDVDICIISPIQKDVDIENFEKIIGRHIEIHFFSEKKWKEHIKVKHELVNSIANGVVLAGHLEVFA